VNTRRQPEILLIEDNSADIDITREGLAVLERPTRLTVISDGARALDYLRNREAPRPDLVLLDLNLPGCRGAEVLGSIKADPALLEIPVVVVSSSQSPLDIRDSYRQHANCYVVKPLEVDDYIGVVSRVAQFWLGTAVLPEA
jgi:two-component system, chemotaxis family, response regulator Rcp1